jgi:hypothetical protein
MFECPDMERWNWNVAQKYEDNIDSSSANGNVEIL